MISTQSWHSTHLMLSKIDELLLSDTFIEKTNGALHYLNQHTATITKSNVNFWLLILTTATFFCGHLKTAVSLGFDLIKLLHIKCSIRAILLLSC